MADEALTVWAQFAVERCYHWRQDAAYAARIWRIDHSVPFLSKAALLYDVRRQHSPWLHDLPSLDVDHADCAGVRRSDLILHLHSLYDEKHLAGLDRLACRGAHRYDSALKR